MALHGPHHSAEKSTTTSLLPAAFSCAVISPIVVTRVTDMMNGWTSSAHAQGQGANAAHVLRHALIRREVTEIVFHARSTVIRWHRRPLYTLPRWRSTTSRSSTRRVPTRYGCNRLLDGVACFVWCRTAVYVRSAVPQLHNPLPAHHVALERPWAGPAARVVRPLLLSTLG